MRHRGWTSCAASAARRAVVLCVLGGGLGLSAGGGASEGCDAVAAPAPSPSAWTDVSSGIPGDRVSVAAAVPGQDRVIAVTGERQMGFTTVTAWSSTDGGATWVQLGKGRGSQALTLVPIGIRFDPQNPQVFWIYGFFAGKNGGLYRTTDGGNRFTGVHPAGMSPTETEDVSVGPGSHLVLVSAHERARSLFKSTDGGRTWAAIGGHLPAGTAFSQYPYIVAPSTYLIGCSFAIDATWDTGNGATGIYRSTDGGGTWTRVAAYKVFASPVVLHDVLYWAYFNGHDGGILESADQGATWTVLVRDHLYYSVTPVVLPGGVLASVNTSRHVVLLRPGAQAPATLPGTLDLGNVSGLIYDAARNALFAWQRNGRIERLDLKSGSF